MCFPLAFSHPNIFRLSSTSANSRRPYSRSHTCPLFLNARGCSSTTWTRRFALRTLLAHSLGFLLPQVNAAEKRTKRAFPGDAIRGARNRLDDVDALIDGARWDGVRTLLRSEPILDAQDAVKALAASSEEELQYAWYGFREDMIQASKLLDIAVYSNASSDIGDSDYEAPKLYLQQLKDAYDALVELSEQE